MLSQYHGDHFVNIQSTAGIPNPPAKELDISISFRPYYQSPVGRAGQACFQQMCTFQWSDFGCPRSGLIGQAQTHMGAGFHPPAIEKMVRLVELQKATHVRPPYRFSWVFCTRTKDLVSRGFSFLPSGIAIQLRGVPPDRHRGRCPLSSIPVTGTFTCFFASFP